MIEQPIKFRVWDELQKKMIYFDLTDWAFIQACINFEGKFYKKLHVMRCMNILDRKKKEIYEGDIVKKHDKQFKDFNGGIGLVVYRVDPYSVGFDIEILRGDHWTFNYPDGSNWENDQLEVIGNKFENAKLARPGKIT